MTVKFPICVLVVALPLGVCSQSQSVFIPAVADAGLREVLATTPGGAETGFRVGNTATGGGESRNRALVRFDVAGALPQGAEITAAKLHLFVDRTMDGSPRLLELRRVLVPWIESQVTWNQRSTGIDWAEPGGVQGADFDSTASAATLVGGFGPYVWGPTPETFVDAWRWQTNAAENFGWMLLISPEGVGGTARRFYSRENGDSSPILEIHYKPPFRIDSVKVSGSKICLSFTATLGRGYNVEYREAVASGDWNMLASYPPAMVTEQISVCDTLAEPQRFYRVEETRSGN